MKPNENTPHTSLPKLATSTAFVCCYTVLIVLLLFLQEEVRRRFFFLPGMERQIYAHLFQTLIAVFAVAYVTTLFIITRAASTWGSRLLFSLMYIPICLKWVLAALAIPFLLTTLVPYYAARTPITYQATVLDSTSYRSRGSNIRAAKFLLPDGATARVSGSDVKLAVLLTRPILVNGVCPLDQLRTGMPITVYARRSFLGYAIDHITSQEPCVNSLTK